MDFCRQLVEEMGNEKAKNKEMEAEMDRLKKDNDRQQKLLSQSLSKPGGLGQGDLLQAEIVRLTSENLVSYISKSFLELSNIIY